MYVPFQASGLHLPRFELEASKVQQQRLTIALVLEHLLLWDR